MMQINMDLDTLETQLLDIARDAANNPMFYEDGEDKEAMMAMARAFKTFAPTFVQFLRGEWERNETNGPANALWGLVRTAAIYSAILAVTLVRRDEAQALPGLIETISALFEEDFATFMECSQVSHKKDN